jgi:drug/metabolite transporter (DMT)-like permease
MPRKVASGFAALCLLSGSTWFLSAYFPSAWPDLLRLSFHDLVLAFVLGVAALVLNVPLPGKVAIAEVAGWSVVLFAAPPLLFAAVGGYLPSLTEVLVFALVPLFTVFAVSQKQDSARHLLLPAVLAFGGVALMLPFSWPRSGGGVAGVIAIMLCAVAVAAAGIRLHRLMQEVHLLWAATVAALSSAVVAGIGWRAFLAGPVLWSLPTLAEEIAWSLLVDGSLLLLTIWLVRELRPIAFSSRFVLVPLVTIVGGLIMTRPPIGWEAWLGLAMAMGASWRLLRDEPV